MQRYLCAALFLLCATLRAATGFPELPGFFAETTAGVYQARGAGLAVEAGWGHVYFGGSELPHKGGRLKRPIGVEPTGGIVNIYSGSRKETNRSAYRAVEYRDVYPGITLRLSFDGRTVKADYVVAAGANPDRLRFRYQGVAARLEDGDLLAGVIRQPAPVVLQGSGKLSAKYQIDRERLGSFRCVLPGK